MTPENFRRAALALDGVIESEHQHHPDFRVGGKIFATLSPEGDGWAMVNLSPEAQEAMVQSAPEGFAPFNGAWGKRGCTKVLLATAPRAAVLAALLLAWRRTAPVERAVATRPKSASRPKKPASRPRR